MGILEIAKYSFKVIHNQDKDEKGSVARSQFNQFALLTLVDLMRAYMALIPSIHIEAALTTINKMLVFSIIVVLFCNFIQENVTSGFC